MRAIVLTGAGERAFCAGSDIKEINRTGRMVTTDILLRAIPGASVPLHKPVIAALHGYCVGFGMTLALHCDLRLAARDTKLGYPEVKHGMISALSAIRLPQVIPSAQALEMMLLARNISADEAYRFGLVNTVVDDVRAEADKWAVDDRRLFAGRSAGDQAPRAVLARHARGRARRSRSGASLDRDT